MRKILSILTICFLVLCCSKVDVMAQYNECGYVGPSNPAAEPVAPINPAYTQTGAVICADASFPECSTPADAAGGTNFAGDCGSPNYDFIITDPTDIATGDGGAAILGVDPTGAIDPAALGFVAGDNVCITGFCYDLAQLQALVVEINGNGSACSAAASIAGVTVCPIPVPSSLGDLFTLAGSLGGGGAVSVGDVVGILPQIDQLGALGITNIPVCGLLSGASNTPDYCMEVVDCAANGSPCAVATCPAITGVSTTATEVCDGDMVNICVDFDGPADDVTVEGNAVATAGDTQICYDVTAANTTCASAAETATPAVVCTLDASPIAGATAVNWTTWPAYQVAVTDPDCAGGAGSAILQVGATDCDTQTGTAGTANVCPATADTDATLDYDFSAFTGLGTTAANALACVGTLTGTVTVDCAVVCTCPAITAITPGATEACSGTAINVCIDFDAAVDASITVDVNGVAGDGTAGGTQICVDVPTDNQTCDPAPMPYTVTADCAGVAIDASAIVVLDAQVYPLLEETITPADCAGAAGSAVLAVAGGGIECQNVAGTAGVVNVCPDTNDTDADLVYDFTGFTTPCYTGTMLASAPIDCAVVCPPASDCTAMAGEAAAGAPTEVCNDAASPVDASTLFDPATGGYTDGGGNFSAAVTNYIAVDATGNIVAVTAAGSTTLDLSALADGETACIYQLAYTQDLLNDVTGFLDNFLCNTLCVDVPFVGLTCLGDVGYCPGVTPVELAPFLDLLNNFFGFNETQICNFIDNQIITITDPTGLIGDQNIDLAANGLDFCVDKSNVYCVTVTSNACVVDVCDADAPEIDPATGDCAADDGDMMETPFTWPVSGASTENVTAPYITEYIVTDAASGSIIGVFSTLAAAETAANTEITADADGNATACIQPINHDSANFEAIITDLDTQTGGLICGLVACPASTLEALYTALAGVGATIDVATVVGLVGAPEAGNLGLDLGALLGLPFPLVVDVPPFCYELGAEVCATNAACPIVAVPFGLDLGDPCNCATATDVVNTAGAMVTVAQETLTITPGTAPYTVNAVTDLYDMNGDPLTVADVQALVDAADPGTGDPFTVLLYVLADGATAYSIDITDAAGANEMQMGTPCEPCLIPTLSEWGLITLALLLMSLGAVKMAVGSVSLSGVGNKNIPMPKGNSFRLPFSNAIFRKSMMATGILALIGFAICFAIYGGIFLPDIIGVAIAGPIFAYLMHLLFILETKKEK